MKIFGRREGLAPLGCVAVALAVSLMGCLTPATLFAQELPAQLIAACKAPMEVRILRVENRLYAGCRNTETKVSVSYHRDLSVAEQATVRSLGSRLLNFNRSWSGPFPVQVVEGFVRSDWCGNMQLWADDSGGVTRAEKLQRACSSSTAGG